MWLGQSDKQIDRFFRADATSVQTLQDKMEEFSKKSARIPTTSDLMIVLALAFGTTAACHFAADGIAPWIHEHAPALSKFSLDNKFFWLIVLATTVGVGLSFTPARKLEGASSPARRCRDLLPYWILVSGHHRTVELSGPRHQSWLLQDWLSYIQRNPTRRYM